MGDLERLFERLREETAARGADWLQATVFSLLQAPSQASSSAPYSPPPTERPRASRSRPPTLRPTDSAHRGAGSSQDSLSEGELDKRVESRIQEAPRGHVRCGSDSQVRTFLFLFPLLSLASGLLGAGTGVRG